MGSRTGKHYETDHAGTDPTSPKSFAREMLETVLVCVIAILFLRAFLFQQSEIPSGSMETTILVGDHVLVNRFIYAPTASDWERRLLPTRKIRRGDIVVFKHPDQPEQDFIKRVIGLPGDSVELRNGYLFVNELQVHEPYVDDRFRAQDRNKTLGPIEVLPGRYFVLGDHRDRSQDSRFWGQVPRELIKGRAFMILFSTSGKPDPSRPPGQVSPKSLGKKLIDLVFHSRWERFLSLIR